MTHPGQPFKVVRLSAMEGNEEMLTVETIRKIKLAHDRDEKSIGQIAGDFNLSRNTVRKVLRSDATRFEYHRTVQPMLKMDGVMGWVVEQLAHDAKQPKKYRRTAKVLLEEFQGQGYEGGCDAVRRFYTAMAGGIWHQGAGYLRAAEIPAGSGLPV